MRAARPRTSRSRMDQRRGGRGTSRSRTGLRLSRPAARIDSSAIARTGSERASATASEQFIPERSLMYFLSFETTIRMSLSTTSLRWTPGGRGGSPTMRRAAPDADPAPAAWAVAPDVAAGPADAVCEDAACEDDAGEDDACEDAACDEEVCDDDACEEADGAAGAGRLW